MLILKDGAPSLKSSLESQMLDLKKDLEKSALHLNNYIEQINCDSKDVSKNIHEIKAFFEQIERHLDLKK